MEVTEPDARYLTAVQRTELGEFPADWAVVPLGKFEPFITSGSRGWAAYYADIGSTFLRITNLSRSCIYPSLKDLRYVAVPPDNSEGVRTALKAGDVLISITADIGVVGLVTEAVELPAYINQHIALVRFAADAVNSRYVAYFLAGAAAQRRFRSMTDAGAKAGMNLAGVRDVLAALPSSTNEQAAIAGALTDADALIDSLEQLLTKKRQIKQGAMQELLTGQRRLPGFSQAWALTRLGDIGRTYGGLTGKSKADFGRGDARYVTFMNVMTNIRISPDAVERVHIAPSESQNMVQPGDLLFNGSSETPEEVAFCSWVESCEKDVFLNSFCFGFRPFVPDRMSGLFMAYFFRARPGRNAVSSLAQGATRYNIAKTALLKASLNLPSFEEQKAIAETLSSMDAELTALESRLAKARALKQAMAQALLTGRIRLVEPTA
jgi:type I restriction enzyme S subunit